MNYQEVIPISRNEALAIFQSGDVDKICHAIVSVAFFESDWVWAQNQLLDLFLMPNTDISAVAATGLGHIARIHGQLEKEKVISILRQKINDPHVGGTVADAFDDIQRFVK